MSYCNCPDCRNPNCPNSDEYKSDTNPMNTTKQSEDTNYIGADEPDFDDSVRACPDCETPNQFGQLCAHCIIDRQVGSGDYSDFNDA